MIALTDQDGNLVRRIVTSEGLDYGYHRKLGFVSVKKARERIRSRRRRGHKDMFNDWFFRFHLDRNGRIFKFSDCVGCTAEMQANQWILHTGFGDYRLAADIQPTPVRIGPPKEEEKDNFYKTVSAVAALILLLMFFIRPGVDLEEEKEELVIAPVKIKIEPKKKVVVLPSNIAKNLPKSVQKDARVKRAIQQNLGFLGLLGKQNLEKAVGGVPTKLKDASAGAGAGGNEGSGGELLVGLGKGVKRVSVGNTGTKGLGGVGTKGRGGGLGGYGNAMVGSGEGKGLSSIPISDNIIIQGGLDKAVIQATIAKYLNQVRNCYEAGLKERPGLAGLVSVHFEIAGTGALNFARIKKSSLGDSGVESCITTKMMNWIFPKPVGQVAVPVNYPFLLRPTSS